MVSLSNPFFIGGVLSSLVGLLLLFSSIAILNFLRIVKDLPTSKIRSIAMGVVELYGKVVSNPVNQYKTPFSNKECVWCNWRVEEYQSGKNSGWYIIKWGTISDLFYLDDGTGTVLVDPKGATIEINKNQFLLSDNFSTGILDFFSKNNIKTTNFFGAKKTIRVSETYLSPNDSVYILGNAMDNPFVSEGQALKHEVDVMIGRGSNFYYVISDSSEKEMVLVNNIIIIIALIFGVSLVILGLILIIFLGI